MYPHHIHKERLIPSDICNLIQKDKQVIEIVLLKEELLRDVEADVHRIQRMRHMEETPIINNDGDYYDIARDIDEALGKVVKQCCAYMLLPSPFAHRISTNHAGDWEEKSIYLGLPYNWPPTAIDSLRNAIHEYIVKSVEFELLTMSMPDDRYLPTLERKKDDQYNQINALLNERLGITPLIQTPFG